MNFHWYFPDDQISMFSVDDGVEGAVLLAYNHAMRLPGLVTSRPAGDEHVA
jgi:hypothetical protein